MNLKPEQGEFAMGFISRFMSDPGMIAKYPGSFQRRHAAEREWATRQGADRPVSKYRVKPVFVSTVVPVATPTAKKRRR